LLDVRSITGRRVGEIGAGTGRFVNIFLDHGAAHVVAVEPSAAFEVLRANTAARSSCVTYLQVPGERLPPDPPVDDIFSIGVLHHIPDPVPVVRAAFAALRAGGRIAIWVYGREGNGAYLALARGLRVFTRALPHRLLHGLVWVIDWPLRAYISLSRALPLPLASYMVEVLGHLSPDKRRLVVYDQLNPAYSKYYRRHEVESLLANAGFTNISLYHRHGYSWAAVAEKPAAGT
jgi:SAM-dependent methyltransferase